MRLIDDDGGVSNELMTVAYTGDILASQVASVTIDNGSAQRSMNRSITIAFDSDLSGAALDAVLCHEKKRTF